MKRLKIWTLVGVLSAASISLFVLRAADHIDGSAIVAGQSHDITDFYAFESPSNADNYVFVINVQGLTAPGATSELAFNENSMFEVNIDTDGDLVEDLVIQSVFHDGSAIVFGPTSPSSTGLSSTIETADNRVEVGITAYGEAVISATNNGVTAFAGSRDDPFFMSFFRFVDIIDGVFGVANPPTSFDPNGTDSFAGTNVLSLVIEVPKSQLGIGTSFNAWAETKIKM